MGFVARTSAAVLAAFVCVAAAGADETDQFLLPTDKPFVDVGRCLSLAHHDVLLAVTEELNAEISEALEISDPAQRDRRLEELHSPRRVAGMVRRKFGLFETAGVESLLQSDEARGTYGDGCYVEFKRPDWIYNGALFPLDPRNLPLLVQSSTIRVYGHYLGTDKLGHFHGLGHFYYSDYLDAREAGRSEEEAVREVVSRYSRGLISEAWIVGLAADGVYSNADLVANYMGFKFYRNLTEAVMLQGRLTPPMLVLVGGYWRLNTHVRPDSDFFAAFVSDHWNEAFNPCYYEWGLRQSIQRTLRARCQEVLSFYCGVDGRPRDPAYFAALAEELSTYFGEDYGNYGDAETLISIAKGCFGAVAAADRARGDGSPQGPGQGSSVVDSAGGP
jgi:hypothetical protein